MKNFEVPIYQKLIQKLPRGRNRIAWLFGKIRGADVTCVVNGAYMTLDLKETIQRLMFLGDYEREETGWMCECLGFDDIFVDVGASFGHYTTLASKLVGEKGRVFAFEPSPLASRVIERAVQESGISNVILTKAAVGRAPGETYLYMPTTENLHSPSVLRSDVGFAPIKVSVISLDKFEPFRNIKKIKLMKIDVEGYEPDVLAGMVNLIGEGRVENVFCEFNSWWLERNSCSSEELKKVFRDLGFKVFRETSLQQGIAGRNGVKFDLQDVWFKYQR